MMQGKRLGGVRIATPIILTPGGREGCPLSGKILNGWFWPKAAKWLAESLPFNRIHLPIRNQPEMTQASLDQGGFARVSVQPRNKLRHFCRQTTGRRCLEMRLFPTKCTGNHLHWPTGIVPPASHLDLEKPGVAGWKQSCMPAEQACFGHGQPAHRVHRLSQKRKIVAPAGPIRSLPDASLITVIHAAIKETFTARGKRFAALAALITACSARYR